MAKRLFVGGLPYATTQDEITSIFGKVGELASVSLITDKFTGQSKGFAFVEYKNDADADKAIETLNNTKIGDRAIVVNVARPLEERKPRDFGGGERRSYGNDRRSNDRRGGYSGGRSQKRW
jgi:cold-inducible RNA-binding protein